MTSSGLAAQKQNRRPNLGPPALSEFARHDFRLSTRPVEPIDGVLNAAGAGRDSRVVFVGVALDLTAGKIQANRRGVWRAEKPAVPVHRDVQALATIRMVRQPHVLARKVR